MGLLRRRTSSNNLGGAVADRRFVGKPHSGKALEHTGGDELRDDFKSFHGADRAPSESLHRGRFAASPRQVAALCFDKVRRRALHRCRFGGAPLTETVAIQSAMEGAVHGYP